MNNHYVEPKTRPTKKKLQLPSVFGSLLGAMIGFTTFIFLTAPYFLNDRIQYPFKAIVLQELDAVLLGPGLKAVFIVGGFVVHFGLAEIWNSPLSAIVMVGVPSIPPTIIGWLIGSSK